jgi:hypothetical protein
MGIKPSFEKSARPCIIRKVAGAGAAVAVLIGANIAKTQTAYAEQVLTTTGNQVSWGKKNVCGPSVASTEVGQASLATKIYCYPRTGADTFKGPETAFTLPAGAGWACDLGSAMKTRPSKGGTGVYQSGSCTGWKVKDTPKKPLDPMPNAGKGNSLFYTNSGTSFQDVARAMFGNYEVGASVQADAVKMCSGAYMKPVYDISDGETKRCAVILLNDKERFMNLAVGGTSYGNMAKFYA